MRCAMWRARRVTFVAFWSVPVSATEGQATRNRLFYVCERCRSLLLSMKNRVANVCDNRGSHMATRAQGHSRGSMVRRGVQITLALAVVVGIYVFGLPRIAEFSEVWDAVLRMTWFEAAT